MIINYKVGFKIFLKILFVAISSFCFYCIVKYPLEGEYLLSFPLIIFCLYGWFYLHAFKIEIGDDFVAQYGIKKKKLIKYEEVVKLEIYTNQLIVKSNENTIKITSDLEKQSDAISFILGKLKPRKEFLKVKGTHKIVEKFLA